MPEVCQMRQTAGMSQNQATDLAAAIPGEIRAERARQNLTQADVFERAGMSKSAYLLIETGKRGAKMDQLEDIAEALGMRLSELILRAESRLSD